MADLPRVTIHDVATVAGVAVSSVSRVFSNHPSVSPSMRLRVEAAVKKIGYQPDLVAQSLRTGTTRTVGLMVRDFSNFFYGEMIKAMVSSMSEAGYNLLIMNSPGDAEGDSKMIEMFAQKRVDALFLATASDKSEVIRKSINAFKNPVVLLDRDFSHLVAGRVFADHATGLQSATKDLIALGHRNIALVTGTAGIRPTRERCKGFNDAFKESKVKHEVAAPITGIPSTSNARAKTKELMNLPKSKRPTAIITGGVDVTIGVLECLSEMGLTPGQDLSLVAGDDLPWLRVLRPRISTVSRDYQLFGLTAADLMLRLLSGEKPKTITLPTRYEARDTSRPV
ncbi:LacI family transcriptional regulator [Candidatus Planktophila versatilis]|uniref:LacI family DNA-binding transcriptional regulator n=1 Tax=Candidatus Planktophila versatilis TaxID=1884905 RepID=UPI000BACAFBF|nr:LacI family DNA-binding transcriptional regulator [Candidatus Planktophila versatilis]ASY18287.1 LacI family transcriptional regulator [Candidatus Planktophila versatilis]